MADIEQGGTAVLDSPASSGAPPQAAPSPTTDSASSGAPTRSGGSDSALASSSPQPAAETPRTLFDRIAERHGIDFRQKYRTDDDLIDGLTHAARMVGQRNQYAEIGQQFASDLPAFQEWLQQRQQPAPQPQEGPWWNPPQFNPAWNSWLDPETGRPVENAPLEVQQAAQKWIDFHNEHERRLRLDFPGALKPALAEFEQQILGKIRSELEGRESAVKIKTTADSIRDRNAQWLYARDPQGRFLRDEIGKPILTPHGEVFKQHVLRLQAFNDQPELQAEIAMALTQRDFAMLQNGSQQQAQPPVPAAAMSVPNANAGRDHERKRATSQPGRSFKDRLLERTEGMTAKDMTF